MPQAGKIVVFSGPSGVGKGTVLDRVFADCPLPLRRSVSATTRPKRPGEVDGRHYYFLSAKEFQRRLKAGDFIEACEVFGHGHWYGTLRSEVTTGLMRGDWVVLEVDVTGGQAIAERYPDAICIFLKPPSLADLRHRLERRGTEDADSLARRLAVAEYELSQADNYRYQVVNDAAERAAHQIRQILLAEHAEGMNNR